MSVGAELREARERNNLTLQDISTRTKISVERLAAIEEMDGAAMPAVVYLQGYLKAYAAEVQLDPGAVVERYLESVEIPTSDVQLRPAPVIGAMDEFPTESQAPPVDHFDEVKQVNELEPASNGALPLELASDRALEPASDREFAPASDCALEPASDGLDIAPEQALRSHDETVAPVPVAAPVAESPSVLLYDEPDDVVRPNSVFAVVASRRSASRSHRHVRRRVSPIVIMVALAVVVGFLVSANIDKIEQRFPLRSTRSPALAPAPAAAAPSTSDPGDEARPDRVSPPDATRADGSDAAPTASPSTTAAPAAPPEADVERARGGADGARYLSVDDVTGTWTFVNRVESSSLKTYNNLELAFRLQLEQAGNHVTGKGEKWTENGKVLSARARTPITVEGTREGDRIELRFTERGARRYSNGTITLGIADAATMHGSFQSDAAGAQGTTFAKRAGDSPR